MLGRLLFILLVAAGGGTAVQAQLLTYSVSIPAASTSWSKTVQLPGFDSSLGTLTGVELFLTGSTVQTVRAENTDQSATAAYDLQTLVTLTAGRTAFPSMITTDPTEVHATGTLGTWDGGLNYGGTSGVRVSGNFTPTGSYADAAFAAYLGASPIDFLVSATLTQSIWSITGSSSVLAGSPTTAGALLEIRYAYASPIPEPAHVAGLLGALAMGAVLARRRKSPEALVG